MSDILDEAKRLLHESFAATSTPDQRWRVHPADPCRVVGDHLVPIADARLAAHAALIARAPTLIAELVAMVEANERLRERKRIVEMLRAEADHLAQVAIDRDAERGMGMHTMPEATRADALRLFAIQIEKGE